MNLKRFTRCGAESVLVCGFFHFRPFCWVFKHNTTLTKSVLNIDLNKLLLKFPHSQNALYEVS